MRIKLWLTALLALLTISTMTAQSGTASEQNASRVSITLDSSVHSEDVDIWYKMVGDFGGHVSFVRPQPKVRQYFITASFENKPAKEMTVVVYATGCQFEALEIDLATSEQEVKRHVSPMERSFRAASLKMSPVINSTDGEEKRTR